MKRLLSSFLLSAVFVLAQGGVASAASSSTDGSGFSMEASYALAEIDGGHSRTASLLAKWPVWQLFEGDLDFSLGARYSYFARESSFQIGAAKSLSLSSVDLHSFNLMLGAEYRLGLSFSIGMNLDAVGFSTGNEVSARSSSGGSGSASPKRINLLLGGASDLGALNSEFYLVYRPISNWALKAGLSHQVLEYESSLVTEKAQRFFDLMFIGLGYDF